MHEITESRVCALIITGATRVIARHGPSGAHHVHDHVRDHQAGLLLDTRARVGAQRTTWDHSWPLNNQANNSKRITNNGQSYFINEWSEINVQVTIYITITKTLAVSNSLNKTLSTISSLLGRTYLRYIITHFPWYFNVQCSTYRSVCYDSNMRYKHFTWSPSAGHCASKMVSGVVFV